MNRRIFLAAVGTAGGLAATRTQVRPPADFPDIPLDYLEQPEPIPDFWVSTVDGVLRFLETKVEKGTRFSVGRTAGGRSIEGVAYGQPRQGQGTTTMSGSLGFGDISTYRGPDHQKTVYLAMAAVHGGEFEGIVGLVNLMSVLETGEDLLGQTWPGIVEAARAIDRIIVIPVVNVDGRTRVPLRMLRFRGTDYTVHEYFNTGAGPDGSLLGWPQVKEFIPLDFSQTQFPGGYPNDAGVNFQHDDFLANPQPETRALLKLTTQERPDIILNLHSGTPFITVLKPFCEPVLNPTFDLFYRRIHTRLAGERLKRDDDPSDLADPSRMRMSAYNLDTALNLNCGGLSMTVESPSHDYSTARRKGEPFVHTPQDILRAQLLLQEETLKFLAETGGRSRWESG
jgi:hypothetical protein